MNALGYIINAVTLIIGGILSIFAGLNALRFGLNFLGHLFTTSAGDPEPIVISVVPYVTIPEPGTILSLFSCFFASGYLGSA